MPWDFVALLYCKGEHVPQPVPEGKNRHAVPALLYSQLIGLAAEPLPDEGHGIVGFDFLDENVPHLVVGAGIFDLMYQLVFHGGTSDPVQLVLQPLYPDPAALLAVAPCQMLVLGLKLQTGHLHGLVVFVQRHHHEVGIVDPVPVAL